MTKLSSNALAEHSTLDSLEQRFWQLVEDYTDRAVAMAYHIVGEREAAKDVAQEAFLKAYRQLGSFRGDAQLTSWFYRILVNQAKNHRRRRWVRERFGALWGRGAPDASGALHGGAPRAPDRQASDLEHREQIGKALQRLSHNQRTVFALVHMEGHSTEEAAKIMGMATGTAKSHLHRALRKLRTELAGLMEQQ